jgi:alpha-tubulin suppressor-like RCC1 family protein
MEQCKKNVKLTSFQYYQVAESSIPNVDKNVPTLLGDQNADIVDVANGYAHTLILKKDGTVKTLGYNGV